MSAPSNAPEGCPRRVDDTSGPRRCGYAGICPLHLHTGGTRGKGPAVHRLRVLAQLDDTCAVDVAERARASALVLPERVYQLTLDEIATLQGTSKQSVHRDLNRALAKVRVLLSVEIER